MADVWHHSVSASLTGEYDSNPNLSQSDEGSVWRTKLVPTYSLIGTFGVDEYKAGLSLNLERSTDQALSEDREDPSFYLSWLRQTETGGFGINARYEKASTRITELEESGLVTTDGTRTSMSLAGNWRSALSERSTLAANAEYRDVTYDGGTYTDYSNLSGGISFSHALSERIEPFLSATASRYEPDGPSGSSSNHYSAQAGVKWKASERLDWILQGGSSLITGETDDTGWQASFGLHYITQRSDLALNAGRYVNPSGEGGYAASDQVKGAWSYAINERTRSGIDAAWRNYMGDTPNTLYEFGAWISRELTPFWSARLSYRYKQRQEEGLSDATENLLGMTLSYSHPGF